MAYRFSAVDVRCPWRGGNYLPDSEVDRQAAALMYEGISAGAAVVIAPVATTAGGWENVWRDWWHDKEKRKAVESGVLPDDLSEADAEILRNAARLPGLQARKAIREKRRDAETIRQLEGHLARLIAAYESADVDAEIAMYLHRQHRLDQSMHNEQAILVLKMLMRL